MEFNIHWISKSYAELSVSDLGYRVESGTLNEQDRSELADKLEAAAEELRDD